MCRVRWCEGGGVEVNTYFLSGCKDLLPSFTRSRHGSKLRSRLIASSSSLCPSYQDFRLLVDTGLHVLMLCCELVAK